MLQTLSYQPSDITQGTVGYTGIDYCHGSLIETKERAMETARVLAKRLHSGPVSLYWSGCANGCANHAVADIGLVGKQVRIDDQIVETVDIYRGGRSATNQEGHASGARHEQRRLLRVAQGARGDADARSPAPADGQESRDK